MSSLSAEIYEKNVQSPYRYMRVCTSKIRKLNFLRNAILYSHNYSKKYYSSSDSESRSDSELGLTHDA